MVLEPVQNAGGCLVPPAGYWGRVREICDQHGVLLVADSTICGFGRLGTWFGAERFEVVPDVDHVRQGADERVRADGRAADQLSGCADALDEQPMFLHGATFGGHPVAAAAALASIAIIEREGLLENVLRARGPPRRRGCGSVAAEQAIVSDVRGMGFFWALELHPAWGDGTPLERRGVPGDVQGLPVPAADRARPAVAGSTTATARW